MNEFETDLEKPYRPAGGWMSCPSCPVETSMLESVSGNGISTAIKRGWDFHSAVAKRDGDVKMAGKVVLHKNSYPKVLAGIGAGAMLGYLVACRLNGMPG